MYQSLSSSMLRIANFSSKDTIQANLGPNYAINVAYKYKSFFFKKVTKSHNYILIFIENMQYRPALTIVFVLF